jgi:PilZ domain
MGTGHRWNERQTSDHSVLISARPHGLRQARIRDVSSSGLFVELPPSAPLIDNAHVELIFVRSAERVSRILRVPALVVRTTQSGAGLMFLDVNLAAFRTLLTQLLAEKKPAAQSFRTTFEQERLDTLQRPASALLRPMRSTETGVTESSTDGSRLNPRLPEPGPD